MRAEIDHHIVDCSPGAADYLGLRMRRCLKVDAAQRSLLGVERDIALHGLGVQSFAFPFLLAPAAGKKPAVVRSGLKMNLENSRQLGFMKCNNETASFLLRDLGRRQATLPP